MTITMIYVRAPARQDLQVVAGNTFLDSFAITLNGSAVDITGWKARWSIWPKDSAAGTTATLALTSTPAAGITLGGVLGTVIVKATPAQTRALTQAASEYQFELEDAAGDVQCYKCGVLTLVAEIAV